METKIYTIFDTKTSAYMQPFFARTDGDAKRMIVETAKDTKTNLHQYPGDFTLFRIGTFNDQDGKVEAYKVYENLGNVIVLTMESRSQKTLAQYIQEQEDEPFEEM